MKDQIIIAAGTVVNGVWSSTPWASMNDGTYIITATATKVAYYGPSSTSAPSATQTFVIDATAPSAPVINPIITPTTDTTPTITGTGVTGDTITLFDQGDQGSNSIGSTTVDANSVWSITTSTLADASYLIMAKATDPVGNISVASPTQTLVIDTTAPSPPVINTIPPTNDTTPIISGIGTIGDTITLFEGSNSIGSTTVDAYSEWSITTSALTDGSYTITAKATDPAGNVSVASTPKTLVIDTTPPVINTISPTNDTTPTITGTGLVPGFRVTIFEGSTNIGIVVVRTENASPWPWAFTLPSALTDGSYIITATKTDSVGNVSSASAAQTLVINTTTNSPPFINTITTPTNDNQPTITGTGVAGHTITLYVRSNIDGAGY